MSPPATLPRPTYARPRSAIESATQALLRDFRRQRPLRGGSLIVTIFGDAIAPRGGVIRLGSLIRLTQPFGLTERLVRTSVARLAQDGWLIARRDGRRSEYALSVQGQERFAEATQRIYGRLAAQWDGHWSLLVLPRLTGKDRKRIPAELKWLGFGEIAPRVFAHPDSGLARSTEWLRHLQIGEAALVLTSTSGEPLTAQRLVQSGWDLDELTTRYARFLQSFAPVHQALEAAAVPDEQTAFVIRTLLIHEYRKIHLQDPLLPPALLPADWVGARAYELCATAYAAVFSAAEAFLSTTASTLDDTLPPAQRSAYARFGGIAVASPSPTGGRPAGGSLQPPARRPATRRLQRS